MNHCIYSVVIIKTPNAYFSLKIHVFLKEKVLKKRILRKMSFISRKHLQKYENMSFGVSPENSGPKLTGLFWMICYLVHSLIICTQIWLTLQFISLLPNSQFRITHMIGYHCLVCIPKVTIEWKQNKSNQTDVYELFTHAPPMLYITLPLSNIMVTRRGVI